MISRVALSVIATVALTATAGAQTPVKWTATQVASAVPGGKASVKLSATIDEGWHIYSVTQGPGGPIPTKITVPAGQPIALDGTIKAAPPEVKFDENFGINVETYEKGAEFTVPVRVAKTAKAGTKHVQINTRYQVCNATTCLPPKTEKLTAALKIARKSSGKSGK